MDAGMTSFEIMSTSGNYLKRRIVRIKRIDI